MFFFMSRPLCSLPADFEPNPVFYFYDFLTESRVVINRLTELRLNSIDLLIRIKKFVQEVVKVEIGLGCFTFKIGG